MTLPQRQRPQPCPTVIFDDLVKDFQAGLVPVDYRMPAPVEAELPEETEHP